MSLKLSTATIFVTVVRSILVISMVNLTDAFCSNRPLFHSSALSWSDPLHARGHRGIVSSRWKRIMKIENSMMIFLQKPTNEDEICAPENEVDSPELGGGEEELFDIKSLVQKVGQNVGKATIYGFSYFMNVVGLYFTFGLILNMFGYAYEFSFKNGYKIDTIQNMRIERAFERESRRYEREWNEKSSQLSVGLAVNSLDSNIGVELARTPNKTQRAM